MLNNNSEISRFEDLMCWQEARKYKIEILNLANSLPSHEIFGLTSQLRRSGSSITANIAEGVGRSLPKAIIQYLRQARGSLYETLDH